MSRATSGICSGAWASPASGRPSARDVPKLCRPPCSRSLAVIEQSCKPSTANHRSSSMVGRGVRHDQHIAEALVGALLMKMGTVFSKRTAQHPLPIGINIDRHSSRTLRSHLSAWALRLGDRGGSRITSMSSRFMKSRNAGQYFVSRSRMVYCLSSRIPSTPHP